MIKYLLLIGIFCIILCKKNKEYNNCNILELCQRITKIPRQDSILSFSIDSIYNNFTSYYRFKLANNSDSIVYIEVIKQKIDDRYFIPLLYEEFKIDSCNCLPNKSLGYHEHFGVKKNLIKIKPDSFAFFEGYTYHHFSKNKNAINLVFDYFYGEQNLAKEKSSNYGFLLIR